MELIGAFHCRTGDGDDQIALLKACRLRRTTFLDASNQESVHLRESNRPTQAATDLRGGYGNTEARAIRLLSSGEGLDGLLEKSSAGMAR